MNQDERNDLIEQARALAYQTIRATDLYRELENKQWDALAEKWGKRLVGLVEAMCDDELTEIEAAKSSNQNGDDNEQS